MPRKAVYLLEADINATLNSNEYQWYPDVMAALKQLKCSIHGRLLPVDLMDDTDKLEGTRRLVFKPHKSTKPTAKDKPYESKTLAAYLARVPRRTAAELLDPWTMPI